MLIWQNCLAAHPTGNIISSVIFNSQFMIAVEATEQFNQQNFLETGYFFRLDTRALCSEVRDTRALCSEVNCPYFYYFFRKYDIFI